LCSVLGWSKVRSVTNRAFLLANGNERGRDGYGFWVDGEVYRGLGEISLSHKNKIMRGNNVVGNFRATPTTEAESRLETLQPYDGIVHNGMIANDKQYGDFPIDSMVLPLIFEHKDFKYIELNLNKIKGSYALAYFYRNDLIMACNYKPIYYTPYEGSLMFASTPDMLMDDSIPVEPYSAIKYNGSILKKSIPRRQTNKVIVAASSGLDSTAVAYQLKSEGYEVTLGHFTYGCLAEERETDRIKKISNHGGFNLVFIEMPKVMKGTITSGTYHQDKIAGTEYAMDWVSGRNLLMLSILTAWAESNDYGYIAFGGNLEESGAYPDNEQEFGRRFNNILPYATQNGVKIELIQPVANLMKHEIVKMGNENEVPWELTWSCYSNKKEHCNNCAPCFMRKTAFKRNGLTDPVFA